MPFSATVLNVLIASPSDVQAERQAISEVLYEWNALHAEETGRVLLPVKWESHSAPAMGSRPQDIINNQVVKNCDMLIGAFWTRLGSSTGVEESGTVEEIKYFLKQDRPVMLYYSEAPFERKKVDLTQLQRLDDFKKSIRDKGIQEEYSSIDDLRMKLMRQLTIVVRQLALGTSVPRSVVKEANASVKRASIAPPPKADTAHEADNSKVRLVDYTEKAFVVRGNTKAVKDRLKEAGGRWINTRWNEKAWMFAKSKLSEVADVLGLSPTLSNES